MIFMLSGIFSQITKPHDRAVLMNVYFFTNLLKVYINDDSNG